MIRLKRIAVHIPPGRVDALERGKEFGYGADFVEGKIGTATIPIIPAGEEASDLCVHALRQLEKVEPDALKEVGALVVCTQTPDGHGIPHTSAVVHRKLGLPDNCACFDISLGCSGYVYGLSIVQSFMGANGIKKGLFFTSDPYSRIIDPHDQATCLVFGDGATVSLLQEGEEGWRMVDFVFATNGAGGDAINNRNGTLRMEGREVFNFAMTVVPAQINALLKKHALTMDEVEVLILHQGSRYIVEKMRDRLKLPAEKAPVVLSGIGNTVSSAVPIALNESLNRIASGRIVISGFGVGLSYATGLLEH